MPTRYAVAVAVAAVVGFGLGAVAVQVIPAQAKPPVYYVAEIDVKNMDAYTKEYVPRAQAGIKEVRKIGEKYAKFRSFAVEGVAQ